MYAEFVGDELPACAQSPCASRPVAKKRSHSDDRSARASPVSCSASPTLTLTLTPTLAPALALTLTLTLSLALTLTLALALTRPD